MFNYLYSSEKVHIFVDDTRTYNYMKFIGDFIDVMINHDGLYDSIIYSPDGKKIAVKDDHYRYFWIYDAETLEVCQVFRGHMHKITSIAFSPDGKNIASASWDMTIRIWDVETGDCIRIQTGHRSCVYSVAYSPDGKKIVSTSWDHTVRVWDLETGKNLLVMKRFIRSTYFAQFSPDGKYIVDSSCLVRVWDARTGKRVRTMRGLSWSFDHTTYSPDGKYIMAVSAKKTIYLWDAQTGKTIWRIKNDMEYGGFATFSPDSKLIAQGFKHTINIWDIETRKKIHVIEDNSIGLSPTFAFTPDGKKLILEVSWDTKLVTFYTFADDAIKFVSAKVNEQLHISGKKVLVLDDHTIMGHLQPYYKLTNRVSVDLRTAPCKGNPIELVKEWKPELIVLDPDTRIGSQDGFELLQQLKEDPATNHIPILIWTELPKDFCEEHESYRNGAADYISKPMDQHLHTTLADMLIKQYRSNLMQSLHEN